MTAWLIAIDKQHCCYEELKYRKVIAQGWSRIGDLSPLLRIKDQGKFKEIITNYISYFYEGWKDKRNPGRILLNLLSIKKGDFVICCEGKTIRGIAKITTDLKYDFQNPELYEYAQCIFPVTKWKDTNNSHGIKLKTRGPVGINKYGGDVDISSLFDQL